MNNFIKRSFDVTVSLILLVVLSPLLIGVYFLILLKMGRPVFFVQLRPGLNSVPFKLLKFRSMSNDLDAIGQPLPDVDRLTRLGLFLRRTSIDELPNLFNVLIGNMSLVGPRPLFMEYLTLYSPEQVRRHDVRPGITGWAQVNGRNALSWDEKFKLDVWYVDNQSFWLDLKILFLTVKKVLVKDGINAKGEATMSKFTGNSPL